MRIFVRAPTRCRTRVAIIMPPPPTGLPHVAQPESRHSPLLTVETCLDDNDSTTEPPPPSTTDNMSTPDNSTLGTIPFHTATPAPTPSADPSTRKRLRTTLLRSYHQTYQTSTTLICALQDTRGRYREQMASADLEIAELYRWMLEDIEEKIARAAVELLKVQEQMKTCLRIERERGFAALQKKVKRGDGS